MKEMAVKTVSHEWNVLEKKKIGKVMFYLLADVNVVDGKKKEKGIFRVVKESKDPMEHFTGRIVRIEDYDKEFESTVDVLKGRSIIQKVEPVPYVHILRDFAICSVEESQDVFGEHLKPIRLIPEGLPEESETLLYIEKIEQTKNPAKKSS
jgi:hypothetical protein